MTCMDYKPICQERQDPFRLSEHPGSSIEKRSLAKLAKTAKKRHKGTKGRRRTTEDSENTEINRDRDHDRKKRRETPSIVQHRSSVWTFLLVITPTALNSKAQCRAAHTGFPITPMTEPQRGSTKGPPKHAPGALARLFPLCLCASVPLCLCAISPRRDLIPNWRRRRL